MTYGKPTTITDILKAITAKVVADGLVREEYCVVTMAQNEYFDNDPPADRFLLISPRFFPPNEKHVTGGGRLLYGIDGTIETRFWNRYEVDIANADKLAIENASLGLDEAWRGILKSLLMFSPVDAEGGTQSILREPMRLSPGGFEFTDRRLDSTWMVIRATWEAKFILKLS